MPAWEDLDAFLDPDDFAVGVVFNGRYFHGIFDEPSYNAETGEYDINSSAPRLTCKASDTAGMKKFDFVTVDRVKYQLNADPHRDGTGMAVLDLVPDFDDA